MPPSCSRLWRTPRCFGTYDDDAPRAMTTWWCGFPLACAARHGSSGTSNTGTSAMIPPQPPPPAAIGRAPRSPPPALPARGLRDRVCLSERRAVVAASRRWAIASSAGLLFPGAGVGYLRWGRSPAGAAADGAVGNICLEHGLPVYLYQHSNGRRHPGPPPPHCSQALTLQPTPRRIL